MPNIIDTLLPNLLVGEKIQSIMKVEADNCGTRITYMKHAWVTPLQVPNSFTSLRFNDFCSHMAISYKFAKL